MNKRCEWYDYETMTCNQNDKHCQYRVDNDNYLYGLHGYCGKDNKQEQNNKQEEAENASMFLLLTSMLT